MWCGNRVFLICAVLFTSALASAQPAQLADWQQSIPGAVGTALAQAPNGDFVVVGIESVSTYDAAYGARMTLQRYTGDGSPVWPTPVRWTSIAAGVRPTALLVDAAGNTFVLATVGDYNYPVCAPEVDPCTGPITIFDAWWLVQKYSPAGTLLWERRTLQSGYRPVPGALDGSGDLYFTLSPRRSGLQAALVYKLSGASGDTRWSASTLDAATPGALALTSQGTVLVAAASPLALSINEFAPANGLRLLRTVYGAAAGTYAPAMALGPYGEIAVTGKSVDGLFIALESQSRQTLFALSTVPGAEGRRVAMDTVGNVIVAGTVAGSNGTNWLLMRFDALGEQLHAPLVFDRHSSAAETPLDLVAAADGAAYITGAAGPGTSEDPTTTQAVTLRLDASGTIDWVASETTGVRGVDADVDAGGAVAVLTAGAMTLAHYSAQPVNQPPSSAIRVAAVSGLAVTFDASGSTDPDGTLVSYRWTFGDGTNLVTSAPAVTHSYAATGTYTASVVAVDNLGLAGAAASASASVVAPPTPTSLTLSATSVLGGAKVTGRVMLSSSVGAVVSLTSSNPAVASVPSTLKVPAGATSAKFDIRTSKVRSNTSVTITATANGGSASAVLTVLR